MIIFALGCFAVAAVALLKLIGLGFQAVGLILKALLQILAWIGAPLDPNTRMVRGMSGRLKPPAPLKPTPTFRESWKKGRDFGERLRARHAGQLAVIVAAGMWAVLMFGYVTR